MSMPPGLRTLRALGLILALLVPLTAAAFTPEEASELLRDPSRILLRNAQFDVADGPPAPAADLTLSTVQEDAVRYWIVQVEPPVSDARVRSLEALGTRVLGYLPNHAYVVRADAELALSLVDEGGVTWVGAYRPDYKLCETIGQVAFTDPARPALANERLLMLSAFEGEDLDRLAAEAVAVGADILGIQRYPTLPRLGVRVPAGGERALAFLEGLAWIEEIGELTHRNNTTRWVAQSNSSGVESIWDKGIRGQGQIIGHVDSGIRMTSCYFQDLIDNTPGPGHRKVVAYRGTQSSGSHGTHTAGTSAGLNSSGSLTSAGIAYEAKLSHTRSSLVTGFNDSASNFYGYLEDAHDDGARNHTNSWGDDGRTTYTWWCVDIDTFSRDFEDDLVLFAVTNGSTLKTPENAKNCLAVGATSQAPGQDNHCTGGRGPTSDGRRKPEIYLPGCGIHSASSSSSCGTNSSSGTSMACPAVTGAAALVRQYYEEGWYPSGVANAANVLTPTAALVKATLLNGSNNMTGVNGYPSNQEGWGRALLDNSLYFSGESLKQFVADERHATGLATGNTVEYILDVAPGEEFRVTMVFTDVAAAHAAALTPVNDLDLEVEGPDGLFRGNVFSGGSSVTGGSADVLNNVERVVLPSGGFSAGSWTIRVRGASIPRGTQGFAIHVSGDVQASVGTGADLASNAPLEGRLLAQNEPNPFAASTDIRYTIPERNDLDLAVFDITGRRVRTLVAGSVESGQYHVSWDGRDGAGERVAPGIYFYRLAGSGVDETRKMVVLR
jgi:subtilisin family serine protease